MARIAHPFDKTPWNSYGFEKGQEVEWFEWLHNYRNALQKYKLSMKEERFTCDKTLKEYITIKEEWIHICALITSFIPTLQFRPYHKAFLNSKKVDAIERVKLKTKLLKLYEEGEHKNGNYYLSIVNSKL